ncbi:MAG: hypothetical protein JW730_18185 [Anaerolineales bacterium]|nr:hypothetical protein [Anaerolineales bacterium]
MAIDFARMNEACLKVFGQALIFTRSATQEEISIEGILVSGAEPEEVAPGDGSIYARLWILDSEIDPAPGSGDEISTDTTIYKIVRLEADAGGGLVLLLRQDRLVM